MQTKVACIFIFPSPSFCLSLDTVTEGSLGKLKGKKLQLLSFLTCAMCSQLLLQQPSPPPAVLTTFRVQTTVLTSLFHIRLVCKPFENENHGFYFWTSHRSWPMQTSTEWVIRGFWGGPLLHGVELGSPKPSEMPKEILVRKPVDNSDPSAWDAKLEVQLPSTCHNVISIVLWS